MADERIFDLHLAQIKRGTDAVRDLARRSGVAYRYWSDPQDIMAREGIDKVEVSEFLEEGTVRECGSIFGVMRYVVVAPDLDTDIDEVVVSVFPDFFVIEVIRLSIRKAA